MKKICSIVLLLLMILSVLVLPQNAIATNTTDKTIKKVVSIVYDDSKSMSEHGEDWAYASYSLQNLIGLMNAQDELSVVKMSKPTETINFDLTTGDSRKKVIADVEGWKVKAGTPFAAVDTAVEWLKTKKSGYVNDQSVEFWLVVLTDGNFETGYPASVTKYLDDLKYAMGDSKFESIFVAMGTAVKQSVKDDWRSVTGVHVIETKSDEDIVNAMSQVSGYILGQGEEGSKIIPTIGSDGKSISFESPFPLRRFIVYQQNQSAGIVSAQGVGATIGTTADFSAKKPGKGSIASRTIHCESTNTDFIPAGTITVTFDKPITLNDNTLKILVDSAVNVEFNVLNDAGQPIIDLTKTKLAEGSTVYFSAAVTSCIDNRPIDLKGWANQIDAQLVFNDQAGSMVYNPVQNAFQGSFPIGAGSNLAYSVITLPGYFRTKSDIVNIYPIETVNNPTVSIPGDVLSTPFSVPYKHCAEYEEVASFEYTISGGNMSGMFDFTFEGMPKGILAGVNGVRTDNNGKVSIMLRSGEAVTVSLYRNKDYTETQQSKITISVDSKQYVLNWSNDAKKTIAIEPQKRTFSIQAIEGKDLDQLGLNDFDGKEIYILSITENEQPLAKDELESLVFTFDELSGIEFKTEVVEYNGYHAVKVTCLSNGTSLFTDTGDLTPKVSFTTTYGEQAEGVELPFHIEDSFTKFIIPIVLLILLVLLIGYIPGVKKRISSKKHYIKANGEDEAIYVKMLSRLLPYVKEKATGSDLNLVATGSKTKIAVINDFHEGQQVTLDGEFVTESDKKITLAIGSELIVHDAMRKTVYAYCDSRDDDSMDFDNFDAFGSDDMFGQDTFSATTSNDDLDNFFN